MLKMPAFENQCFILLGFLAFLCIFTKKSTFCRISASQKHAVKIFLFYKM